MQFEVPYKLNVSGVKQVAIEIKFSHFADAVRPLAKKAPEEFDYFMAEFEKAIGAVERWRPPRGKIVRPAVNDDPWPNGKSRYKLYEKPPPSPYD